VSAVQLWLFDAAPPPPPLETVRSSQWETLAIEPHGQATYEKVEGSYSGLSLATQGKVLRPFRFRGADWVNTGSGFFRGNADFDCYRIVPPAEYPGPGKPAVYDDHNFHTAVRDDLGSYHGMLAKRGREDVVLIGPPIVLVHRAEQER